MPLKIIQHQPPNVRQRARIAAHGIKVWMHHPMVLGVKVWALAHLQANHTLAGLLLFGGIVVWAVFAF